MAGLGVYQKIVIRGTGPGAEVWQTGFHIAATTVPASQADLQTLLNTIAPYVDTWWTAVKASAFSSYVYTTVDAYQYVDPATTAQYQATSPRTATPGSLSSGQSTLDQACVVSLRSANPSRSGRNRMYVPCHAQVQSNGMFLSATTNTAIGTATKTLFSSIAGGTSAVPIVASRAIHQALPLVSLITDNKPDIQRRRINRINPTSQQVLAFP